MASGRFLSKSIAHDLELNTVSLEADYLFARCIPHLDREGRMPGHPTQVKGMAVPLRTELTVEVVEAALHELNEADLIVWYEAKGRMNVEFPGFSHNQTGLRKDREAESKIPSRKSKGAQRLTRPCRSDAGVDPAQVGAREVKPSEAKVSSVLLEPEPSSDGKDSEGDFAALVRKHLWQSKEPPSKGWNMGREINIRRAMVKQGEEPEAINGVIAQYQGDPVTMRIYWAKEARQQWSIGKARYLSSLPVKLPVLKAERAGDIVSRLSA